MVLHSHGDTDEKTSLRKRCVSALDQIAEEDYPAGERIRQQLPCTHVCIHRRIGPSSDHCPIPHLACPKF
jgi:hypothetical protein